MPDGAAASLATGDVAALALAVLFAGLVYGFAGFGSALIFLPVATAFVAPPVAVGAFAVGALGSVVAVLPRAWAACDRRATLYMVLVSVLTLPLGLLVLRLADPTPLRWGVLAVATVTLVALLTGWRYRGSPTRLARGAVAGATGFVGGATGLNGPVIVLFNLAGSDPVKRVRANNIVFLTLNSMLLLPFMAVQGMLPWPTLLLGLVLLVPYGIGAVAGQAFFVPRWEPRYRAAAYAIIAAAILVGLPVWS
jgi:uncharacterized membrane protein YfcA